MDRLEIRVSLTKVLLILIVVIVPLSVVGLALTENSDRSLDNAIGNDFKTIAQLYSSQASQYVRDRVADVIVLASNPVVVSAASGHAEAPASAHSAQALAGGGGAGMLNSNASQLLRFRRTQDPRFLALTLTDQNGNVVAASQQPAKTSYAQDAGWQGVFNNGQGKARVGDILDDEFTKQYYMNVGVPVNDQASGSTLGVLTAAVNVTPMLNDFKSSVGNGARAELVNENGLIVSAPNADVFAQNKSQAFDVLHDSLGAITTQTGAQKANLAHGPYLIGYAGTGLKQLSDNLGWIVVVSQEEHQATAPIRQLVHFALIMVILALFMLTLLCVYYFLHRTQRFEDIEGAYPPEQTRAAAASR
ncbi:MAG: cache domain-containing protein [Acidobacteriaceae bacterium]|nr:cache domain-containing protein [Acidobacteriaceae bacterium]